MNFTVDVKKLSAAFYAAYPQARYPEILRKTDRPYTCLLIETHQDYLICVPFRSEMRHKNGFHFSGTKRSAQRRSGLDYQKIVLVKDRSYIDRGMVVVDQDEYTAVMSNIARIVAEAEDYVQRYVDHVRDVRKMHEREFQRKYQFSTLPYFEDILGITQ